MVSKTWSANLEGYEGSYDGDLEAVADGPVIELTLVTRNPNYGGASGLGTWTLQALQLVNPLGQGSEEVVASLRAWAREAVADASPPFSKRAALVSKEPVAQALEAVLAALAAGDLAALKAAHRLAPTTLDALTSSRLWGVISGQRGFTFSSAVALRPQLEALLASWRGP